MITSEIEICKQRFTASQRFFNDQGKAPRTPAQVLWCLLGHFDFLFAEGNDLGDASRATAALEIMMPIATEEAHLRKTGKTNDSVVLNLLEALWMPNAVPSATAVFGKAVAKEYDEVFNRQVVQPSLLDVQ